MKEGKSVEYKEKITNDFIKTVSAYANYRTGKILFGVRDDGTVLGIENPDNVCLDIENKINDLLKPKPDFSFEINRTTNVITLTVYEGSFKPYLYKGKAYKRNDTSTVEVDQVELKRLIMIGHNLYFDGLIAEGAEPSFTHLSETFKKKLNVENLDTDVLKTLGLLDSNNNYNNAALLLSDTNSFPGVDIARFGSSINEISFRETLSGISILEQLDQAEDIFNQNYRIEEITGMQRNEKYLIPKEAYRETLANALVHRTWDVDSNIRVLMHPDRIEVFSPGGLPPGLSVEEYLNGYVSKLRNPVIANVFFRLKIIEAFGTGIRRIKESYSRIKHKPFFEVKENSIYTLLPSIQMKETLTHDEKVITTLLSSGILMASSEIVERTDFSKDKVIRLLNSLIEKQCVAKTGSGRGTRYQLS